jgi:hypothetical protein
MLLIGANACHETLQNLKRQVDGVEMALALRCKEYNFGFIIRV